jgi:hypothetical protein
MFTLEQVREFTQKIDDYINQPGDQNERIRTLLRRLEKEFSDMFQEDFLTTARHQYFTFRIDETYYVLMFEHIGSKKLRMFAINKFTESVDSGGLPYYHWGETTPAHQFIYHHCNPKGVLIIEKILFEEII